jgi:hypothetical protein
MTVIEWAPKLLEAIKDLRDMIFLFNEIKKWEDRARKYDKTHPGSYAKGYAQALRMMAKRIKKT